MYTVSNDNWITLTLTVYLLCHIVKTIAYILYNVTVPNLNQLYPTEHSNCFLLFCVHMYVLVHIIDLHLTAVLTYNKTMIRTCMLSKINNSFKQINTFCYKRIVKTIIFHLANVRYCLVSVWEIIFNF